MRNERGPVLWVLLAWSGFLLTSGLAQVQFSLPFWLLEHPLVRVQELDARSLGLLAYCLLHLSLFGVGLPLLLARWSGLSPYRPAGPRGMAFWGGLALIVAATAGRCLSLDLTFLAGQAIPLSARVLKCAFLLFPWVLGQCLFLFLLFPRVIEGLMGDRLLARVVSAVVAVLGVLSLSHVESQYGGVLRAGPVDMLWMVPAVLGAVLSRSPLSAFVLLYPAQVLIALVGGEQAFLPWRPFLAGFLLSFWSLCLFLSGHSSRRFPPREAMIGHQGLPLPGQAESGRPEE